LLNSNTQRIGTEESYRRGRGGKKKKKKKRRRRRLWTRPH